MINVRCNFNDFVQFWFIIFHWALQNFSKLTKIKSIFYGNNISLLWLIQAYPLFMMISISLVYICLSYISKTHISILTLFNYNLNAKSITLISQLLIKNMMLFFILYLYFMFLTFWVDAIYIPKIHETGFDGKNSDGKYKWISFLYLASRQVVKINLFNQ